MVSPGLPDLGIFAVPFLTEFIQFGQGCFLCWRGIDQLEICHEFFQVLVGDVAGRVADLMNDAVLDLRIRIDGLNSLGELFNPSTQAIRISFTPRFLRPLITDSQNFALSFSPTYPGHLSSRPCRCQGQYKPPFDDAAFAADMVMD